MATVEMLWTLDMDGQVKKKNLCLLRGSATARAAPIASGRISHPKPRAMSVCARSSAACGADGRARTYTCQLPALLVTVHSKKRHSSLEHGESLVLVQCHTNSLLIDVLSV
jgi:hypothetical protein